MVRFCGAKDKPVVTTLCTVENRAELQTSKVAIKNVRMRILYGFSNEGLSPQKYVALFPYCYLSIK